MAKKLIERSHGDSVLDYPRTARGLPHGPRTYTREEIIELAREMGKEAAQTTHEKTPQEKSKEP